MNNEADRSGTLDRRAFLGTASASLALMGVPVQAAILSNAGKDLEVGTPGNIDKQPSVFLTRDGRVTATMIRPVEPTVLSRMAEERITSFVKRHANLVLPSLEGSTTLSARPDTNLLVLGTPKSNPLVAKWVEEYRIELEQAGTEGYALRTWNHPNGTCCVLIASNSDKGVFHAATHLTEYWLKAEANSVAFPALSSDARPAIPLRGTYNLACWGLAPRYSLTDWEHVVDAMAEDHMNFVLFWLAGLFRSKRFPESFIYPETPLTHNDIHVLIKYAQDRGIRFYLGSGAFAWFGQDQIAMYHPEAGNSASPFSAARYRRRDASSMITSRNSMTPFRKPTACIWRSDARETITAEVLCAKSLWTNWVPSKSDSRSCLSCGSFRKSSGKGTPS